MKKIDWYILSKFLKAFFFIVILLVAIVCIINLTEMNEKFIENRLGAEEIAGYYVNFAPYIANMITPITVFIAVVFVTSQLATHTEIIAMLSSGISFLRISRPYLIGSLFIAGLSFYFSGWIIPNSNKERIAFETTYLKKISSFSQSDIHMKVGPNSYLYVSTFNSNNNTGYDFTLETIEGTTLKAKLSARRLVWEEDSAYWSLDDWTLHTFDGMHETFSEGKRLDTVLTVKPKDLASEYMLYESLNMKELNKKISDLEMRGADNILDFRVEKYVRFMSPFTVIILTFIGLFISSKKSRGGSGFQIALGFFIAFIFIILFTFARSVADAGSWNPVLAIWMPNIVFSGVGIFLYKKVPK